MKVALGTAQFGTDYGISNSSGLVPKKEVGEILKFSLSSNINTIDTAIAYGKAQRVLGSNDLSKFKIISKVPKFDNTSEPSKYIIDCCERSLNELNVSKLHCLMFHSVDDLLGGNSNKFIDQIDFLKSQGIISNAGFSIYGPEEVDRIKELTKFDIVQVPFNIFDQRLKKLGTLEELKKENIEVHARSIFLQGLLLIDLISMPSKFLEWEKALKNWEDFNIRKNTKKIESAIHFVKNNKLIDKLIFGVESLLQLQEIVDIYNKQMYLSFEEDLSVDDEILLNPSKWPNL